MIHQEEDHNLANEKEDMSMIPNTTTINTPKIVGCYWASIDDTSKGAQRKMAGIINMLQKIGSFLCAPPSASDTETLKSLSMEFKNMTVIGRNAISSEQREEYYMKKTV